MLPLTPPNCASFVIERKVVSNSFSSMVTSSISESFPEGETMKPASLLCRYPVTRLRRIETREIRPPVTDPYIHTRRAVR